MRYRATYTRFYSKCQAFDSEESQTSQGIVEYRTERSEGGYAAKALDGERTATLLGCSGGFEADRALNLLFDTKPPEHATRRAVSLYVSVTRNSIIELS
jgi:hypothetical protein